MAWLPCCSPNIKQLLAQAAKYTFLVKPAAHIREGIPVEHTPFWTQMSVSRLHTVYTELSVSTSKVLSLLSVPVITNKAQECAWEYLQQFVGDMGVNKLHSFLRFVTVSFVISVDSITVIFRWSRASTSCSATLEVSTTCSTLLEFVSEFRTILLLPSHIWVMDTY